MSSTLGINPLSSIEDIKKIVMKQLNINLCKKFVEDADNSHKNNKEIIKEFCRNLLKSCRGKRKNFLDKRKKVGIHCPHTIIDVRKTTFSYDVKYVRVNSIWIGEENKIYAEVKHVDDEKAETLCVEYDSMFDWILMFRWLI